MSMRKLKHHEQRLLRKVDFLDWKADRSVREATILRQYHVEKREDYAKCAARLPPPRCFLAAVSRADQPRAPGITRFAATSPSSRTS